MSNVAKLKKQAAEFELKKQFDKALAIYVRLLDSFDQNADELDVALFNRVGDLMLRQGSVADAVDYYEQAVDRYADTGFFNNAIALCNKILRHSPGRASVYYKLGKISAQKGFKTDAKVNFLEYADRMQKAGKVEEAFRALQEFADLCPDQDEIRLMLADQLTKAGKKEEAIEQLQTLYERYDAEGRTAEAAAVADRVHAIDPGIELRSAASPSRKSTPDDLIFLDLDAPSPSLGFSEFPRLITPMDAQDGIVDDLITNEPVLDELVGGKQPRNSIPIELTRIGDDVLDLDPTAAGSLIGLESTQLDDDTAPFLGSPSLLDLEATSLGSGHPTRYDSLALTPLSSPAATPVTPVVAVESQGQAIDAPHEGGAEGPSSDAPGLEWLSAEQASATGPVRPTPETTRAALDGLTVLDADEPTPEPAELAVGADRHTPEGRFGEAAAAIPPVAGPDAMSSPVEAGGAEDLEVASEIDRDDEQDEGSAPASMSGPGRHSTMVAAHSAELLRATVEAQPDNCSLRRQFAEALLDAGDRDGGVRELESAMAGAERMGDLDLASGIAEEVARLEPDAVRHHQKRVEYAFRTSDRGRLIEAYLGLADALLRSDQPDKSRAVYQRVLDLAPDDVRARAVLETIVVPSPEPPLPSAGRAATLRRPASAQPAESAPAAGDGYINLGDWLRDDEVPRDTRMVVAEAEPTGDEDADFADMLRKFKQGVADNVDPEDYQSHYDLAIAFKEMGLVDEAIAEFQKALGSPKNRVATFEALGQCFIEKNQYKLASSILSRALAEGVSDEKLIGVLYLMGIAAEAQGNAADALTFFQRVFIIDIQFRDIVDRLSSAERAAP